MMDEATWMRHANPWSVWTRNTALPLLVFAVWSRIWLGWSSLLLVLAALLWIFFNPRIFSPPVSTNTWASRGVLGERVWLNRDRVPIPPHHRWMPHLLNIVAGIGLLGVIWGTFALDLWPLGDRICTGVYGKGMVSGSHGMVVSGYAAGAGISCLAVLTFATTCLLSNPLDSEYKFSYPSLTL